MHERLFNRRKKLIYNVIFRLVTLVSIAVMLIFCIYLRKLHKFNNTTLIIIFAGIAIVYLIMCFLIIPRKFKLNIKIIVATIFIITDFILVFGIRKIDKKINNNINNNEVEYNDSNS